MVGCHIINALLVCEMFITLRTETKKIKRFKDRNGGDMATRTSVCLYQQSVTWIFTRSILRAIVLYDII